MSTTLLTSKSRSWLLVSYAYFFLLALVSLIGTAINARLGWTDFAFLAVTLLPVLVNRKECTLFFAILMTIVWSYLLLAVTSDLFDYLGGKMYSDPVTYFGVGYSFFLVSLSFSILLIVFCKQKIGLPVRKR